MMDYADTGHRGFGFLVRFVQIALCSKASGILKERTPIPFLGVNAADG